MPTHTTAPDGRTRSLHSALSTRGRSRVNAYLGRSYISAHSDGSRYRGLRSCAGCGQQRWRAGDELGEARRPVGLDRMPSRRRAYHRARPSSHLGASEGLPRKAQPCQRQCARRKRQTPGWPLVTGPGGGWKLLCRPAPVEQGGILGERPGCGGGQGRVDAWPLQEPRTGRPERRGCSRTPRTAEVRWVEGSVESLRVPAAGACASVAVVRDAADGPSGVEAGADRGRSWLNESWIRVQARHSFATVGRSCSWAAWLALLWAWCTQSSSRWSSRARRGFC